MIGSRLASFVVLFLSPICAPLLSGSNRPSSVPEGYVITPFGYFHPSCTRLVAEGETVLPDGRIQHVDGSVEANAPVCSYPHYSPTGSLMSDRQEIAGICAISNTNWVESISATTSASYGKISATWTVPPKPNTNDGQTVFFFPGFVDCANTQSILQPVLQYGVSLLAAGPTGQSRASTTVYPGLCAIPRP